MAFLAAGVGLPETTRRLGDAVPAAGRLPEQVLVLADLQVVLSDDPGAARERAAQLNALAPPNDAGHVRFTGTPAELADHLTDRAGDGVHGFACTPPSSVTICRRSPAA